MMQSNPRVPLVLPFAIVVAAGLTLAGGLAADQSGEPSPDAMAAEEIPVTTSSDVARDSFVEGQYLLDVGRVVQAREKFQAAVEADPSFAYGYFNLSNASLSFAEFQQSLDQASAKLEGKSEGERLLVEINRTFLTNASDEGLALARSLTEKYPKSARAWMALAAYQGTRNENEAARSSASRALELDPRSTAAVNFLANNYLRTEPKDFAQAETWTRKLIEKHPDEAKAYELLGDVKRGQNDLAAAEAAYTQATETDPTLAVAQLKRGHVNSFLHNIAEARAAFSAGVEHAVPENKANFANYLAFTGIHAGDVQGSLDELLELADAVKAMGTPADQVKGIQVFTLTNHATAALHSGKLDQAAKSIGRRNSLQREIAETVGTEDAERLLEVNCHMWDGLLAAYRGDYQAATEHAEEIDRLVKNDANPRKLEPYHWILGQVALRQGDTDRAVEHLRQANHANNMFIRYHLALAEEKAGNTEAAKKLFREVAEWNFNSVGYALVHEDAAKRAAG